MHTQWARRFVSCTALAEAVHNHVYGWRPDDDFESLDEEGKAAAVKSCLDVLVRELSTRKLGILQIARQCDRDSNGMINVTEFGHRHASVAHTVTGPRCAFIGGHASASPAARVAPCGAAV